MPAFHDVLVKLLRVPGASYSCVADGSTGLVVAEMGTGTALPAAVLEWGAIAGRIGDDDALDDVMITSRRSYRLVRRLPAGPPPNLLVYLCLDRARSNLAVARRELAAAISTEPLQASPPALEPSTTLTAALPGPVVPLPRRAPSITSLPARPLVPGPGPAPSLATGRRWATDTATMHRLLTALRALR